MIEDKATHMEGAVSLTPTVFQILLALADSKRHGYGIMREITLHTSGATRLGPGTSYSSIKRLPAKGLIAESDECRRYYHLTAIGRRAADAEACRLARLIHLAQATRVLGPGLLCIENGGLRCKTCPATG